MSTLIEHYKLEDGNEWAVLANGGSEYESIQTYICVPVWAAWETAAAQKVHGYVFTHDDLRCAFEALLQHGAVELTKPYAHKKHALKYEMRNGLGVDWRTFFLNGPFNAKITRSGEEYWKQLGKRTMTLVSPSSL